PRISNFAWVDKHGDWHDFEQETQGRPAVVVLILNNCPLCDQQYQDLEARRAELDAMGVALVAVTSQTENMPVFKALQAYDDFEDMPIHGLYIVNGDRDVVWQDLSADAFMEIDFLVGEIPRSIHAMQPLL